METERAEWIAVDWGTSNLRAWGITPQGDIAFARASDRGMGRIGREDYPSVLAGLIADHPPTSGDVLICGMAGARQGWLEAPYLDAPADLASLAYGAVSPDGGHSGLNVLILPGVCQKLAGEEDVMRGEETQLLGLSTLMPGFAGLAIMPGTHSKWALLDGTRIQRFSTVMTGELFELLRTHSVLRHSLQGDVDGPERGEGFDTGLSTGLDDPGRLPALLFKIRAGALLSGRTPGWCAGFLSGLLIGAEVGGQRGWIGDGEVPLIGSTGLCGLYAQALARIGAASRVVDATDATIAGLKAARKAKA